MNRPKTCEYQTRASAQPHCPTFSLSSCFLSVEPLSREMAEATGACAAELGIKQGAGVNPIPPLTHWASLSSCVTSDPQCSHLGNKDKDVHLTEDFVGWKKHRCFVKCPGESMCSGKRGHLGSRHLESLQAWSTHSFAVEPWASQSPPLSLFPHLSDEDFRDLRLTWWL